ncbi:low affinity iron permease family protein [Sulfuricurvum sp.]|uniref:low affinity iron permease family protein n=1 Tax=Sulfuricurvum sp. TaxID=2025608 RepID=UPI0035694F42
MYIHNKKWYTAFTKRFAAISGRSSTFGLAIASILVWMLTGPYFNFSNTWQLVINTSTTIITFIMVFVIQNTQNRDTSAIQIKLDELIRSTLGAHNALLDLEELEEEIIKNYQNLYQALARKARMGIENGDTDTNSPSSYKDEIA